MTMQARLQKVTQLRPRQRVALIQIRQPADEAFERLRPLR